ncbi:MAG: hypothetical protein OEY56_05110 [Cyclobacteriaceae bacterium]|nr:hypothetical protein [Cyclobacteriaceae bacterium]
MKSFLTVIALFFCLTCMAQKQKGLPASKTTTANLKMAKEANKRKNSPQNPTIRLIIKNDGQGILYGNPCMREETRRMHFEYAIQVAGLPGSLKPFKRTVNNLKTKGILVLTRSPFWKVILHHRTKDCRERTGDRVG